MLADVPRRRGRPPKFVKDESGADIAGLSPLAIKDDAGEVVRYRYYATYSTPRKWFGHDRDVAISVFRGWQASQEGQSVAVPTAALSNIDEAIESGAFDEAAQTLKTFEIDEDGKVQVYTNVDDSAFWAAVRQALLTSRGRKLAAEKCRIPQLAYLFDLDRPVAAPTLTKVRETFAADYKPREVREHTKALGWWDEFVSIVQVERLDELNRELFKQYRKIIEQRQQRGKKSDAFVRNRVGIIRQILRHALTELNVAPELDARLRLDWKGKIALTPPPMPRGSQKEITPAEFSKLLDQANEFETCILLVMLNAALYPVDIRRMTWEHLNLRRGTMVFIREKKDANDKQGTVRVAVLWRRTVAALSKLKKLKLNKTFVFALESDAEIGIHVNTTGSYFRALRKSAKIKSGISPRNLRDSALTIAAQNAPEAQYRVLAGHVLKDTDDAYIIKNPRFVALACKAIERRYIK
jgi:integrase